MYGLLLDSIQKFIRENYGERCWVCIRRRAKVMNHWFVTHEVYSDTVITDLVDAAAVELGETPASIMMKCGEYFVQNIGRYGYARLLRVLGRDMRDFLNGLDDLHEYLRFSYPKMKPPSFYCENETSEGILLHYTTRRNGFLNYVIGQLYTVGRIYGKELDIIEKSKEVNGDEIHYVLELRFDNSEMLKQAHKDTEERMFEIDRNCFPFSVVFDESMTICRVGCKLKEVFPNLIGQKLDDVFAIRKPRFGQLCWNIICSHPNCVYELVSVNHVLRHSTPQRTGRCSPGLEYSAPPPQLKLKGQMLLLKEQSSVVFLCSPAMDCPEELYESGIFINDLAMHDSSRDYILAGSQQNPELNLALHQEKIRSAQLEESSQRTDRLLYQMIPKSIADQLRNGETPLNTCREFESVSILFSDVVSFTPMCSRLRPMEVVCVLNAMFVAFDQLCDKHNVYKVETIGDGYMVICGAPEVRSNHAMFITDFAFSIIEATSKINDPSTSQSLRIRVGIHSGTVVAGVVGATIPRYDVFGDSVNIAARMEATGEPMRIHVSKATAELLHDTKFVLEPRGLVEVKGKGLLPTYWVKGMTTKQAVLSLYESEELTKNKWPIQTPTPTDLSLVPSQTPSPAPAGSNQIPLVSVTHAAESNKKLPPDSHQWPQADWILARRQTERRSTIPDLVSQEAVTPPTLNMPQDRRSTLATVDVRELQSLIHSRNHRLPETSPPLHLTDPKGISAELSELNLMNIRSSLSLPMSPLMEDKIPNEHQLAIFATMAEENARQARCVADWASGLARLSRRTESVGENGSSVDICPFHVATSSRQCDTPSPSTTPVSDRTNTTDSALTRQPPTSSGNVRNEPCTIL